MLEGIKRRFQWLFSPHYKMERFGVMFGSLALCMAVCLGTIFAHKAEMDKHTLGTNVMYTTEMTMSLSRSKCQVVDIFSDSAQTKAFILLKWENMANVVTDAGEYKIFLTGSDLNQRPQDLLCSPQATIYVFGTTGYMGIYLVDMAGFQSQILDLVLRCDSLAGTLPTEIPSYEDKSFEQFDQGRIYFNPGASGFKTANFLDTGKMDVRTIYNDTVISSRETEIREKLTEDLDTMNNLLLQTVEYRKRVEASGIVIPAEPIEIRGDRVVEADDTGRLELVTDYVVAGGYDYDWYNGNVLSGYLDGIVPGDQTASRYMAAMRQQAGSDGFDTRDLRWLRVENGTDFYADDVGIQSAAYKQTDVNIKDLTNVWKQYFAAKKTYQTTDLESLLLLELDAMDISSNFTTNAGTADKPAIVLY